MHHIGIMMRAGKCQFYFHHNHTIIFSSNSFLLNRVIYGLSEHTKRGHILRATLEAVCFQVRDILEAMTKDCNFRLTKLRVDGGMTASKLLLQLQSDLVGIDVIRPKMAESTALVSTWPMKNVCNLFLCSIKSKYLTLGCSNCGSSSRWQMGLIEADSNGWIDIYIECRR